MDRTGVGALSASYEITFSEKYQLKCKKRRLQDDAKIKGGPPQIRVGKREKSEMLLDNALHLLSLVFYRLPYLKSFYEIAEITTGWLSPEYQTA